MNSVINSYSIFLATDNSVQAHRAMFEKTLNQIGKPSEVVAASLTEREKELELLRTRYDRQKQVADPEPEKPKAKIVERVCLFN